MHLSSAQKSKSRTKIWDALTGHYGGLVVQNGSTQQSSISAIPSVVTGWNTTMPFCGCVVADNTLNTIIVSEKRDFLIAGTFYFLGQATKDYIIEMYINDVASGANIKVRAGTAIDAVGGSYTGIIELNKNDVLDIRVSSDDGGTSITPTTAQFMVDGK